MGSRTVRYLIARDFTRKIVQRYGFFSVRANFQATFFALVAFFSPEIFASVTKMLYFCSGKQIAQLA